MARTQRMRQRDREAELVEIAYRLIAQNGLEGFRIRQVAAEAGIDNGPLHLPLPEHLPENSKTSGIRRPSSITLAGQP